MAEVRQIGQVVEAEPNQEFLGGRVQEWPADDLFSADDLDEMPLEQRVEHARCVHAPDLADFQSGDRLLVCDDGKRFERLHRQLLGASLLKQAPHPFVKVRAGDNLVPAGHFHQLQASRALIVAPELGERRVDVFLRLGIEQGSNRLRRQRFRGGEDQRLEDGFQVVAVTHDGPPGRRSDAAHPRGVLVCTPESAQTPPLERRAPVSTESSRAARGT